jgi:L-aminopeptidase/D-esterase-like protein
LTIGQGLVVGALAAVNSFGDVIDPSTGRILAGVRSTKVGPFRIGNANRFADTLRLMRTRVGRTILNFAARANTVLGVVAVNADLTKSELTKVAQMAQDGIARTIRPAHTMLDGDTVFALASGGRKADVSTVGAFAAEALGNAVLRSVLMSSSAGGLPGLRNSR